MNIYFKTYKLTLKRKKAKPRVNAKKVTTRLLVNLPCLSETWERKRCFKPWNSKIVYQNSRLATIPTFNMIKVYQYDNRGDACSPTLKTDQNLAYIALFIRRNKPQNVLNISQGTSNMAYDTLTT